MTPSEILFFVSQRGIKLWAEDRTLRYHAPKGALTAELRKLLTEHKDRIIAYLDGKSDRAYDTYPLSYNQQFLWFLYHLVPQSSAYNVAFVARVVSPVDFSRLEAAFQKLIDRHPMLRTTYDSNGGVPSMRIHSRLDLTCEHIDATGWSEEALQREVHRRYSEPFDLAKGPILRVQLFTCGPEDHVLLLTIHHIACDGWSMRILLKEFDDLYSTGAGTDLPAGGAPYTDFTRYQTAMLKGPEGERLLSFWKQQLTGELPELNLPADKQRPHTRVPRGGTYYFSVTGDLYRSIVSLARSSGATLYTFLLASFQALLMRYSSQEEILIGTPMASRPRKEDERTVGCYINTIVLRGTVEADSTFQELLGRTRKTFTEAFEHQHYPFPLLVEQLSPARDPSRTPIFQVLFNFLNRQALGEVADLLYRDEAGASAGESVACGALKMRPFPMDQEEGQFDLDLQIIDNNHSLTGLLKYSTDLYEEATIARMASHFEILLQGIVSNPNQRLSELPLLTADERNHLLFGRHAARANYPQDKCLHEWFEAQAERTPGAIAVVFGNDHLTYRELNFRANRLAHSLRSLGVAPDALVGLFMERSLEMVIGILGILKAGGAYVPLDPIYPKERLSFIIEDMRASVIVTQQRLAADLPPNSAKILYADTPETGSEPDDPEAYQNPRSGAAPGNLAYVIYTSGSTGKPKGVLVTHANVVRLFKATEAWFHFGPTDVWTMFHSYAFDFSVWELWGAVLYGGRLVVIPYEISRSPGAFLELLAKEGVTVLNQTPSAFKQLIQAEESVTAAKDLSLRLIIFGGEALELQSLKPWIKRHGDQKPQLVNMYGITETTVHVTYRPITGEDVRLGRGSVIGIPIPDLQVYVLDRHLQPVPVGVPGELYVGGAGVARGYLNRPELTGERFIANPFSNTPGERLYKSGDVARYLPDQDLEYLGRADRQVQVRGFRVELGEIETVLGEHEAVREVLAIAREDIPGEMQLVAYIVPQGDRAPSVSELRNCLRKKLPEYMVPNAFLILEKFPLTPNGKIDRRSLPVPTRLRPELGSAYVAPRTEMEQKITAIWQAVLHLENIGVNDNFFDLGGHSLRLAEVHGKLREKLQRDFSMLEMFEYPTINSLAQHLSPGKDETASFQMNGDRVKKLQEGKNRMQQRFSHRKQS